MNRVPENQTVSFTTYSQAIHNALPVSYGFLKANAERIERAFGMGEPIWCIVDELKLVWELTRGKYAITPRQAAKSVTVCGVKG